MTTTQRLIAVLGLGLAASPIAWLGQAQRASPTGATTQEQPPTVIEPADQATKEQMDKFADELHLRDQAQLVMKTALVYVEPIGKLEELSPEDHRKLMDKFAEEMLDIYPIDQAVSDMSGIFQKYVPREDVDAAIAFYGSPAGQCLMAAEPKASIDMKPRVYVEPMPSATQLRDDDIKAHANAYRKYLSHEDLDAAIAFWRSPAGEYLDTVANKTKRERAALFIERRSPWMKDLTAEMDKELEALKQSSD